MLPGSTHDLPAARELVLAIAWHYTAEMPILADGGYEGARCGVLTSVSHRNDGLPLHVNARTCNKLLRGPRCLGERSFAVLTERWKALEHVTISPRRITKIARAALAITSVTYCDAETPPMIGGRCAGPRHRSRRAD